MPLPIELSDASLQRAEPSDSMLEQLLREALEDTGPPVVSDPRAMLRAGDVLAGRFSVHGLVRRGGMGAIYRGFDLCTGDSVAIKILGCLGVHVQERFLRETRILAELVHPCIVRHIAHGTTDDGTMYLIMEWLQGEDLAERLLRQRLDVTDTLALLRRVCEALEIVHASGVVHRDIKPANLFLTGSDPSSVKLLDFGVASHGRTTEALTQRGTLLGTVGYMAPEQAQGDEDIDARADVFALGCVLYECLTGRAPFSSAHPVAVLAKVLHEQPPRPSLLTAGLDPRLDTLVAQLLAKNRQNRMPHARAILDYLGTLAGHPSSGLRMRRTVSSTGGAEQRIVSVILGRTSRNDMPSEPATSGVAATDVLHRISVRFGAQVASLEGGALLLVSSGRGEANDRASQAALCALELYRHRPELTLAVSTGLAETFGGVHMGVAIDRAAAQLAQTEQVGVYLDEVTLGLIGLRFEVQQAGAFIRLLAARPDFDAPHVLMGRSTPHVGRERELATLDGVLDEVVNESVCRMVFVTGPAGIGKSRLASEWFARGGRGGSVRALFARADPSSAGSALSLVQRLLRDATGVRESDGAEQQRQGVARHLGTVLNAGPATGHLIEFVAEILGVQCDGEPSSILRAARASAEIMREQMRRVLQSWLDLETARQPVAIVLEDLHWADPPSVAFLTEAVGDRPHRPLMILALARPQTEKQFAGLSASIAVHLRLLGLAPRAAQRLVDAALEQSLPADVLARVIQTADGNPFILEELIRRLAMGGTEWPDTVLAMVQSRIERLDANARCVLRVASVFGERCWDVAIAEVMGGSADVKGLLRVLSENELLIGVSESRYVHAREYRFRHALLRDAAYAMMTEEDRRIAHGIAGEWLERNHEKDASALADHYEKGGLSERALPCLVRAAKAAVDAGDTETTIELANRGVELGAGGVQRGRLLLLRSYAEALAGAPNLAVTREAVDLLPIGSAPWWLGLAVLIFGSSICGNPGEAAPYVAIAVDAPFIKDRDVPFGQGLVTLIGGLVLLGKSNVAEAVVERAAAAMAMAPEQDPIFDAFLASARCALAAVAPLRGKWQLEMAYRDGQRCAAALGAVGATHGQMVAEYYVAVAAMHLGLYEVAANTCRRAIELAQKRTGGLKDGWPWLFLAKAYLRLGRADEALQALAYLDTWNDWAVHQMVPVLVAEAYLRQGKLHEAEQTVRPAFAGVSPRLSRLAACVLARAQLLLDRPGEALQTIDEAFRLPASNKGLESDVDLLTLRAEALFAAGRREDALQAATAAKEFVEHLAADIGDAGLRRSFTESVEPCARALSLHRQWAHQGHAWAGQR
jgi:tetratricopeptide (TPR) repeat protein